ncbi:MULTISPECIES: phosphate-starvation-inducible PsiE family protein [Streptococcus]|uniref:Phosphate-starvation-inducible PsiE family protein n=1 Tax=Streptococcus caledonicus TaxID=2614158 RepID=A0ABW0UE23_9STRE|nr:phosphate-starvation-inducible PsiE family protein [Streptococcus sp. S784/96/1]
MRKFLQTTLYELSFYVEILISLILVLVLLALTGRLFVDLMSIFNSSASIGDYLQNFLNQAMSIAIGVELIKMLSKHTSGTIVEVLLFAVARQLVISHGSALDTLLSVLAIAALFATRKYLFISFDDASSIIVRGSQKVRLVNVIAKVNLKPNEKGELLRDFMVRHLEAEEKTVAVGASVYFTEVALRIDSIKDGKITRVEVIKSSI